MERVLILALALTIAWLAWRTWREAQAMTAQRGQLLDEVARFLDDATITPLPSGFTKVSGTYRGLPAVVELVLDTLNVRKLPVLWLMVTAPAPVAVRATFDLMMRAGGLEVFSRFRELPHAIEPPPGFPEWSGVRTDNPQDLPSPAIVAKHLQRFHDGIGKELLVTPKGVRMVVMLDQADRGGYLIFRDARMALLPVKAEMVQDILDDLHALRSELAAEAEAKVL